MMTRIIRSLLLVIVSLALAACGPGDPPQVQELSQEAFVTNPPEGALVLDVRTWGEFSSGHVSDAVNIPHDQLASRIDDLEIPLDQPIVVYCKSGVRAGLAASVLLDQGFSDVYHLEGDMDAWHASGLPTD